MEIIIVVGTVVAFYVITGAIADHYRRKQEQNVPKLFDDCMENGFYDICGEVYAGRLRRYLSKEQIERFKALT